MAIFSVLAASSALGASLTIPGTANPWLAGISTNGFVEASGDSTPGNSPVLFTGFAPGAKLQFSVPDTDLAGFAPGSESGPDGVPGYAVSHGAELGVGAIQNSLANALIGVFLPENDPDREGSTPPARDFASDVARNYSELQPELLQPFYIGNGRTTDNLTQTVIAPPTATRLFLGITDGSGWYNNTGAFHVDLTVTGGSAAYSLTLNTQPQDGGTISATPAAGPDGKYAAGTVVHLSAAPNQHYYFAGWSGVDTSDGAAADVRVSADRTVTAAFEKMFPDPMFDDNCTCAIDCLVQEFGFEGFVRRESVELRAAAARPVDLTLLRAFRDQVMNHGAEGAKMVSAYYALSPEIAFHAFVDSELRSLVRDAVTKIQPLLADMVSGTGEMLVSGEQVSALKALLAKLDQVGGASLKSAIQAQLTRIGSLDSMVGKSSALARLSVAGVQVAIVNPKLMSDGTIQFTVTGVLPAGTTRVQSSEDLLNWSDLAAQPIAAMPATFSDARTAHYRYYRVISTP